MSFLTGTSALRPVGIIFAILILWMTTLNLWASTADAQPTCATPDECAFNADGIPGTPIEIQAAGASLFHSAALARATTRRLHETTPSLANPVHADCLSQWSARVASLPQLQQTQAPPPPVFRPLLN